MLNHFRPPLVSKYAAQERKVWFRKLAPQYGFLAWRRAWLTMKGKMRCRGRGLLWYKIMAIQCFLQLPALLLKSTTVLFDMYILNFTRDAWQMCVHNVMLYALSHPTDEQHKSITFQTMPLYQEMCWTKDCWKLHWLTTTIRTNFTPCCTMKSLNKKQL